MKQINYLLISMLLMLAYSCEDELYIDPITNKSANNFYSNEQELESGIIGVYSQLQSNGLYGLDLIGVGEIPGDDSFEEIAANDGGRFGQLDDFSTNANNSLVERIWEHSYRGVQRANTILNRIEDITYTNETIKTNRIGEMKFVRALLYFNLVRLYGDVPLVIEETTNPFDYFGQGRTPVSEVYSQIQTDLTEAIEALPLQKSTGRPAKGAAQALLADVYLTLGKYNNAASLLGEVVNSGQYSLMPSTSQIFGEANEGNPEILFEVQFTSGYNADGSNEGSSAASQFRPSGTTAGAKGHNLPTKKFADSFEANDTRKTDYISIQPSKSNFYFTTKYEVSSTGADDGGSDHIIIRFADVLLKYAEALNENGNTPNAIIQLNKVRKRAGLTDTSATTQANVREAIRQERRFELIGEGHRWLDLKRYGNAVQTMNAFFKNNGINITINDNNLILPIPQGQIDTDPESMTQNPGY